MATTTESARFEELRGWTSAEAKRRFASIVSVIAVLSAGLQLGLPLMGIAWMTWRTLGRDIATPEVTGAAVHDGRVWYIERVRRPDGGRLERLANVGLEDDRAPEPGPEVPKGAKYLVADQGSLWVVGTHDLARVDGVSLTPYTPPRFFYWPSPPLTVDGRPAVLDWYGGTTIGLLLLNDGRWERERVWYLPSSLPKLPTAWAGLVDGAGGYDFFMEFEDDLRWRHVDGGAEIGDPRSWEQVTDKAGGWTASRIAGEPTVIQTTHEGRFDFAVQTLRREGGSWRRTATLARTVFGNPGVVDRPHGSSVALLPEMGRLAVVEATADGFGELREHGTPMFMFDWKWGIGASAIGWAVALPMALALTRLMRRARIETHAAAAREARFASVWQRGIAQAIDSGIVWGATAPLWWKELHDPLRFASPKAMLAAGAVGAGGWMLTTVVAAWLEGRWGVTPGKWLLGIRVLGTDHEPCGFGRALVRNMLRVFDGFMSFTVGMLFVAFTADWQRLGDVAARTIVVRRARLVRS